MEVTQDIKLDINDRGQYLVVSVKQADSGRKLRVTMVDGDTEITVPSTATVSIRVLKQDGTSVDDACTVSDGKIIVALTSQITAVAGYAQADISVASGGKIVSTATFLLKVGAVPVGVQIVSTNEFLQLTQMIQDLQELDVVELQEEITDIRTSADGTVYASAGDAVRGQVTDLKEDLTIDLVETDYTPQYIFVGHYIGADGLLHSSDAYAYTHTLKGYGTRSAVRMSDSAYEMEVAYYDDTGDVPTGTGFIKRSTWTGDYIYIPSYAKLIALSFHKKDATAITDADIIAIQSGFEAYVTTDTSLTLNNIPADAKATGERITPLESAINDDISIINRLTWESGYVNASGNTATGKAYLRTIAYYVSVRSCPIYFKSPSTDYWVNIAEWDENDDFVKRYEWKDDGTALIIDGKIGHKYKFMIHDANGADISSKATDTTFLESFIIGLVSTQMQIDEINVEISEMNTKSIKVIGIGNSYTWYVYKYICKILQESGYTNVIIGQCYKGATTLQEQYENREATNFYDYYRKYENSGLTYTNIRNKSLVNALADEDWDVVVFQQQSDESGQYNSFFNESFSINDLIGIVKASCPNAKIGIVSPWTHATGYTGEKFIDYYNGSVENQNNAINATIPRVVAEMNQCDFLVDLNAIVNIARENSFLGTLGVEMLQPDKNHIAYGIPDYMCGCLYAMNLGADINSLHWYPTLQDDSSITTDTNNYLAYLARQAAKYTYNKF